MKNYKVKTTVEFDKEFDKLDNSIKIMVLKYLKKLENSSNPLAYGKELSGNFSGLYRFRINNYRLIAEIKEEELIIYAIGIGNRSTIYKRFRI